MDTDTTKTPIHLWIVGVAALLWNGFGCFDYLMTRTRGAAYIESMMHTADGAAIMAYIDAFPIWAAVGWGLGVWGGLAGAILLLMRHRWAVPVLLASLVGAIVGIGYQLANPSGIGELSMGVNAVMPYILIAIAIALFLYARAMRIKDVLR
ncbi:MAG: hypothetical protein ABIU10_06280 [Sphingomicrobium sp.]